MDKIDQLFAIVETLVHETKGWLPHDQAGNVSFHSTNLKLAPDVRAKLAFLEACLGKAQLLAKKPVVPGSVQNPDCCGSRCVVEQGEVRTLPIDRSGDSGNLILCRNCFEHEMNWRRERNKKLGKDCQYSIPAWEELSVYAS